MEEAGADVTIVRDGQQAVDLFIEKPPKATFDAILMDIMMPVMDGLSATRVIRVLDREDARDDSDHCDDSKRICGRCEKKYGSGNERTSRKAIGYEKSYINHSKML